MGPRIFLIRHGETAWSLSGRHTGRTDIPLTGPGEDAARRVGEWLRPLGFVEVLASPRQRARQTGLLAALGPAVATEPDLAEWDYGDYEGRFSADILGARPDWNLFRDGCPHGESPAQVADRADRLLARLRGLAGNVALFTHGHFGRVLGARWIGLPVLAGQHLLLGTASVSILGHEHDQAGPPAIVRWNAAAPEAGADRATPLKQPSLDRWENEGGEIPAPSSTRPRPPGRPGSGPG